MQLGNSVQLAHIAKPVKPSEPESPPGGNVENRQPPARPAPPPPPPANETSASSSEERNNAQNSGRLSADVMTALLKAQEEGETLQQELAEGVQEAGEG
ncbi:MAG TPA: hypothetical protein ENJ57_05745 [Rhizobiales bacterium]|nr:hypothetical protein [Hyphomicrobiales bacterium]